MEKDVVCGFRWTPQGLGQQRMQREEVLLLFDGLQNQPRRQSPSVRNVTSDYSIKANMGERNLDSTELETLVLPKDTRGTWKIRHSHTSSGPARRPAGQ